VTVLTTPHRGAAAFDQLQPFRVERTRQRVLLPTAALGRRVRRLAAEVDARLVVLDPVLPLGLLGARLDRPYAVVIHGAEVSVPARVPATAALLRRVLLGARHVIAAGEWVLAEANRVAGRELPATVVPPGVDVSRFRPLAPAERAAARAAAGLPPEGRLVACVTRLVPRKGMDVLIAAASLLAPARPDLVVAIAGGGRDRPRLERLAAHTGAPARLLGPLDEAGKPSFLAAADVFAMPCRNRWLGLEQEGFGIVFVEAAACGVPQVAGASGGAVDAVLHGETGFVVRRPEDPLAVARALSRLLDDADLRARMGSAARLRAEEQFEFGELAAGLDEVLLGVEGG
jgi:phosphatidylinositol alpha-1,6-mannosyltransferase